jgi:hypothetical protein
MSLVIAALLFTVFALNVALGAFWNAAYLGDVGEMLVLLAASTTFVVAILKKEADRSDKNGS